MANEKRLIDANELITAIQGTASEVARTAPYDPDWFTRLAARQVEILYLIDEQPTVDAVSRGVHDQVRWERDVAIGQLESYGISLGEKADAVKVVRCKDCKYCIDTSASSTNIACSKGVNWRAVEPYGFCSRGERRDNG